MIDSEVNITSLTSHCKKNIQLSDESGMIGSKFFKIPFYSARFKTVCKLSTSGTTYHLRQRRTKQEIATAAESRFAMTQGN
jgi:hypothetical protein